MQVPAPQREQDRRREEPKRRQTAHHASGVDWADTKLTRRRFAYWWRSAEDAARQLSRGDRAAAQQRCRRLA